MGMEKWGLTAGYTLSLCIDAWNWETIHQDQIRQILAATRGKNSTANCNAASHV